MIVEGVRGLLIAADGSLVDLGGPSETRIAGNATPPAILFDFLFLPEDHLSVKGFRLIVGPHIYDRALEVDLVAGNSYTVMQTVEIAS